GNAVHRLSPQAECVTGCRAQGAIARLDETPFATITAFSIVQDSLEAMEHELCMGAWQFRWDFSLGGVTYLSSWGNIWFQRPLRWRVASARKASSPLRLQNWPVSLKRRWYWEQVDSIAPEPTGWPRAFPLL